jgi:toxin YoeB
MSRKPPAASSAPAAAPPPWQAIFDPDFLEDSAFFVGTTPRTATRILDLVKAVLRDPFQGIGKPEPLRGQAAGAWSRRISQEHRLVYHIGERRIFFLQARYHYEK